MVWICAVRGQLLLALNAPECGLPRNLGERLSAFVGGSGGNGRTSLHVSPARRLLMLLARWTAARNVTCPSVQHFLLSRSPVRQQRLIFVWDRGRRRSFWSRVPLLQGARSRCATRQHLRRARRASFRYFNREQVPDRTLRHAVARSTEGVSHTARGALSHPHCVA